MWVVREWEDMRIGGWEGDVDVDETMGICGGVAYMALGKWVYRRRI